MIQEIDALDFIGELSQSTGVMMAVGVNACIENPDPGVQFRVLIDPSSFSDGDESKLEAYAERRGLEISDEWSDWGRFIKIFKPRLATTFSP
jgi:hypothetical protein